MIAGLTPGAFIARDRAEAAIFLAFRPWLLVVLAAVIAGWPARPRWCAYVAALMLAGGSEALLVAAFGGRPGAGDALRMLFGGLMLAVPFDLAFVAAQRAEPRFWRLLGALLCAGLLLIPGPRLLFERIALAPEPSPVAGPRPAVTLLTGLPLLWAEAEPVEAAALRPNAAMRRLSVEFRLRPIDVATPAVLAAAPLLLAAQPRELSAGEIEAVDAWVRMGGRALLLVDADLRWPSALPPGDARRPPRWATLAPLLARWNLTIARGAGRIGTLDFASAGGRRRIVVDAAGLIRADGDCRMLAAGHAAACRIGRGQALILADADMLDDRLWVGAGIGGDSRLRRGGDNAVLVAEWLDRLAGRPRDRSLDSVTWIDRRVREWVFVGALLPALLIGLFCGFDIRRNSQIGSNPPHMVIHRNKAGRAAEMRGPPPRPPPH